MGVIPLIYLDLHYSFIAETYYLIEELSILLELHLLKIQQIVFADSCFEDVFLILVSIFEALLVADQVPNIVLVVHKG